MAGSIFGMMNTPEPVAAEDGICDWPQGVAPITCAMCPSTFMGRGNYDF